MESSMRTHQIRPGDPGGNHDNMGILNEVSRNVVAEMEAVEAFKKTPRGWLTYQYYEWRSALKEHWGGALGVGLMWAGIVLLIMTFSKS